MRIAIIGRSEILYDSALLLLSQGHSLACVVTAKEAPEYTRTAEDFRALAEAHNVPFLHAPSMKERQATLKDMPTADIAVSYNYTGVIPQEVIDLFPLGILNAHGGDLPRYRGNACQAWALLNAEEKIGLCVHRMIGGELDSGPIVARDYLPVSIDTKITEVHHWMHARIPELFAEAVHALADDDSFCIEHQSTDPSKALRCYPRRPEDGRIEWHKSAADILRLINASNKPYAGAFCGFEGEKLIIWDAKIIAADSPFLAVAGQVMRVFPGGIDVATGDGCLRITHVQYQGNDTTPDRFILSIRKRLDNGAGLHG